MPEAEYRKWHKSDDHFELGKVQLVRVEEDIWVANLLGQHGIGRDENGNPPIRYEAIKLGMIEIHNLALELNASIHMPRIGCGLAGGSWDQIQPIIEHALAQSDIETIVYDFG